MRLGREDGLGVAEGHSTEGLGLERTAMPMASGRDSGQTAWPGFGSLWKGGETGCWAVLEELADTVVTPVVAT